MSTGQQRRETNCSGFPPLWYIQGFPTGDSIFLKAVMAGVTNPLRWAEIISSGMVMIESLPIGSRSPSQISQTFT